MFTLTGFPLLNHSHHSHAKRRTFFGHFRSQPSSAAFCSVRPQLYSPSMPQKQGPEQDGYEGECDPGQHMPNAGKIVAPDQRSEDKVPSHACDDDDENCPYWKMLHARLA